MRYIELNPVRAGLVERPEAYAWSSYRSNVGMERVAWLTPHDEFMRLGASAVECAGAWRELVAVALGDEDLAAIRSHASKSRVLGDDRFQRRIAAMLGRSVHIAPPGRPWPARELPSTSSPQPMPARPNSGLPVTDG
jgi:putative transposase